MRLLRKVSKEQGAAILVVTHDERIIGGVDRVLQLVDGARVSDQGQKKVQSGAPKDAPKVASNDRPTPSEGAV